MFNILLFPPIQAVVVLILISAMEENGQIPFSGVRKQNMINTFKWAIHSLQTSWSKEVKNSFFF